MGSIRIIKSNGEAENFNPDKLRQSLLKAGAKVGLAEAIVENIVSKLKQGDTTRLIYRRAFDLLKTASIASADKYHLKEAMMQLGPTGYPFEVLTGEILKAEGYQVKTGQLIEGQFVNHEVDVVAEINNRQVLIECKFHNHPSRVSDVKVPLYIQSRFQDIKAAYTTQGNGAPAYQQGGIFTNTRFTVDAMTYGKGVGLRLVSWNYPYKGNLPQLMEDYKIYPVTAITSLTGQQHKQLIAANIISCKQLLFNSNILKELNLNTSQRKAFDEEIKALGF